MFDRSAGLLQRDGVELPLPPRVVAVLDLLVARAGQIVRRQELIDEVWKEAFVTDTSLAEAVSALRQALGDDPQSPRYIQTLHRRGYRFVAPVTEVGVQDRPAAEPIRSAVSRRPSIGWDFLPWGAAIACALVAAVAIWQLEHLRPSLPPVVRLAVEPAAGTSFDHRAPSLALSPDGSLLVWSGCAGDGCRLYVRHLDRLDAAIIDGTEDGSAPFFSPDGRWIGFFAGGKLKKVALAGGAPVTIADAAQVFGGAWLDDGTIVFAPSATGGLMRVSDRGGTPMVLTTPSADAGEMRHAWPSPLPGGAGLLFTIGTSPLASAEGQIAVLPLNGRGAWQTIVDSATLARGIGTEYLAFMRGSDLHAVAFNRTELVPSGTEQSIVSGVAPMQAAASSDGSIAYAASPAPAASSLAWWSASGMTPLETPIEMPALSPDGKHVAGVDENGTGADVRVLDLSSGAATRLTYGGVNVSPVWRGDGAVVYYSTSKDRRFEIRKRDWSASGPEQGVLSVPHRHVFPTSVSRDGRAIVYVETGGPSRADLWMMTDGGPSKPLVRSAFDDIAGVISPDGSLLAYQSDESGRWEIYLQRLDDGRRVGGSAGGGRSPFWAADGRTLFYTSADALVGMAVSGSGEPVGAASRVAAADGTGVGADGSGRVLFHRPGRAIAPRAVVAIQWVRELRGILGSSSATSSPR